MTKRWTAHTTLPSCGLSAQAKSSKAELVRRLLADDPCWLLQMTLTLEKPWRNKHFRRGLAIRSFKRL